MSDYDMKIHGNPDAQAWAKFFIQTKEKASWQIEDIDESLMLGWFANAMMAMHDSQRTWVGLTDDEIDNINYTSAHMLAREVETKLKEKNCD
jgi:hypothetical protein